MEIDGFSLDPGNLTQDLLQLLVGERWPNGDEGAMRSLASAWSQAAEQINEIRQSASAAAQAVGQYCQGENGESFSSYWSSAFDDGKTSWPSGQAPAALPFAEVFCQSMSKALDAGATQIETTKDTIMGNIAILVATVAPQIAAGFFDFGATDATAAAEVAADRTVMQAILDGAKELIVQAVKSAVEQGIQQAELNFLIQLKEVAEGHADTINLKQVATTGLSGAEGGALGAGFGYGLGKAGTAALGEDFGTSFLGKAATGVVSGQLTNASLDLLQNHTLSASDFTKGSLAGVLGGLGGHDAATHDLDNLHLDTTPDLNTPTPTPDTTTTDTTHLTTDLSGLNTPHTDTGTGIAPTPDTGNGSSGSAGSSSGAGTSADTGMSSIARILSGNTGTEAEPVSSYSSNGTAGSDTTALRSYDATTTSGTGTGTTTPSYTDTTTSSSASTSTDTGALSENNTSSTSSASSFTEPTLRPSTPESGSSSTATSEPARTASYSPTTTPQGTDARSTSSALPGDTSSATASIPTARTGTDTITSAGASADTGAGTGATTDAAAAADTITSTPATNNPSSPAYAPTGTNETATSAQSAPEPESGGYAAGPGIAGLGSEGTAVTSSGSVGSSGSSGGSGSGAASDIADAGDTTRTPTGQSLITDNRNTAATGTETTASPNRLYGTREPTATTGDRAATTTDPTETTSTAHGYATTDSAATDPTRTTSDASTAVDPTRTTGDPSTTADPNRPASDPSTAADSTRTTSDPSTTAEPTRATDAATADPTRTSADPTAGTDPTAPEPTHSTGDPSAAADPARTAEPAATDPTRPTDNPAAEPRTTDPSTATDPTRTSDPTVADPNRTAGDPPTTADPTRAAEPSATDPGSTGPNASGQGGDPHSDNASDPESHASAAIVVLHDPGRMDDSSAAAHDSGSVETPVRAEDSTTQATDPSRADDPAESTTTEPTQATDSGDPASAGAPADSAAAASSVDGGRSDGGSADSAARPGGEPAAPAAWRPPASFSENAAVLDTRAEYGDHGLSLFADPVMADLARRVGPDPSGAYDVNLHTDQTGGISGDRRVTGPDIAELALAQGVRPPQKIRITGCEAGARDNGLAAEVSRLTGCDVIASDSLVWSDEAGHMFASTGTTDGFGRPTPDIPPTGTWQEFHPDGSKTEVGSGGFPPGQESGFGNWRSPVGETRARGAAPAQWDPPRTSASRTVPDASDPALRPLAPGERFSDRTDLPPSAKIDVYDQNGDARGTFYTDASGKVTHAELPVPNTRHGEAQTPPNANPDEGFGLTEQNVIDGSNPDAATPPGDATVKYTWGEDKSVVFKTDSAGEPQAPGVWDADAAVPVKDNFTLGAKESVFSIDPAKLEPNSHYTAEQVPPGETAPSRTDFWTDENGKIVAVDTWKGQGDPGNPDNSWNPNLGAYRQAKGPDGMRFPPGVTFRADGKVAATDEFGRPTVVSLDDGATVQAPLTPSVRSDRMQREAGGVGKAEYPQGKWDGGHKYPAAAGGASEITNYFSQDRADNQGHQPGRQNSWYTDERDTVAAINHQGAVVTGWDIIESHETGTSGTPATDTDPAQPPSFNKTPESVVVRKTYRFPQSDGTLGPPRTTIRFTTNVKP